jgi:hypothetical protein
MYHLLPMWGLCIEDRLQFSASQCLLPYYFKFIYIILGNAKSALSYTIHPPILILFLRFRRLRIFAKSNYWLRHVLLSVSLHVSAGLPLEVFPLYCILGTFEKIRRETPHEVKIGQK